jgi:hypothetical protein
MDLFAGFNEDIGKCLVHSFGVLDRQEFGSDEAVSNEAVPFPQLFSSKIQLGARLCACDGLALMVQCKLNRTVFEGTEFNRTVIDGNCVRGNCVLQKCVRGNRV